MRIAAAAALGDIGVFDAVPPLIQALDDVDELVRTAASDALMEITDERFAFEASAPIEEREATQEAWRRWWKDNKDRPR